MENHLPKTLIYKLCFAFVLSVLPFLTFAQIEVEPTGPIFTPESLISNVFLGEGVQVTNINYIGTDNAVGYFTNGLADIGIDRGIIMASGQAITAATANTAGGTTGTTSGSGTDPDLNPIASGNLNDIAKYEISFIPTADTLRFKYVFASEEYPEYACSGFNDVFGFFITGPNPAGGNYVGQNIALVPDLSDPTGLTFTNIPVTINNVNPGVGANGSIANCTPPAGTTAYGAYYNSNIGSTTLTYDGYLNVFIAQAIVVPCEEYTIKLAVADVGDSAFDTGVFLEAKSFGTGSLEVDLQTVSLDGTITEDCASASLSFSLPTITDADYPIDYTIIGTAINGLDYEPIPLDLMILQGDSSVSIDIIAHEDGLIEGAESIGIDVQRDPCNRDTFWLFIRDNELIPPNLGPDTTICKMDSVQLNGLIPISLPPPPTFTNNTNMSIVNIPDNNPPPPGTLPTQSQIQVFGVQPVELQEGVIKRICIDVDHVWISDVDVFLTGPNGQFLELTTDNGTSGDDYTQTCFTPVATNPINFGSQAPPSAAPFTGDWQPEGSFEDLWTIQDPLTNGTWTLQVKDDQTGFNGTLLGWSICFNPLYQIEYSWTPSAGLSCDDCPNPVASPDSTTTYILTASDTYGCEVYDTITVNILDILPPPDLTCGTITDNSIDFCWDDIPGASGYEVSVNGGSWITSNNSSCHSVTGLTLSDTVTIIVHGISGCSGENDTLVCFTPDCTPPDAFVDNTGDASCFEAADGTAMVSALGTYPPFIYMVEGVDTNSTGVFNGLAAGDYTVAIIDDVGCPQNVLITIGEPEEIIATGVLITNASCNGGTDGTATVTVTGGTSPYSFVWESGALDSIATNLATGFYGVTVTDINGCTSENSVEVTEPPVMSLDTDFDSVSCNLAADGTATVIVTGGVGPYTYEWDPTTGSQNTETATGLGGGDYTVIVTDQNGCMETTMVTVIENEAIVLDISGTDVPCFGENTGTSTVIASGGTGTYTYLWNDPLMQNTAQADNLTANNYNVVVTDSDGCAETIDITINEPTELTASATNVAALCFGDNNGVITIFSSGGTYPYTYTWSDNPGSTDSVRIDLIAADYTITVADVNGCQQVIDVTISEPTEVTLDFSFTGVACNGGSDGTATVQPTGGTSPYNYQWDANAANQTNQTATDLLAGTFFVTVTDANGCTAVNNVDVSEESQIQLTETPVDVLCFGNNTGSVAIDVIGGVSPYSFDWSGPGGYTSSQEDINNLFSGAYTLIVTDANDCTAMINSNIAQPSTGIISSMSAPDTICNASVVGTATVSVNGGTGPYTYNWSNGMDTPNIGNLSDGIYFVTITDNGNCTFVDTAFVVETEVISINLSQVGALCHDGNEGTATIESIFSGNESMPISEYDIEWNPSNQNTPTASNLIGGQTYTVIVTDDRGCTSEESITIGNPDEIGSVINNITDVTCFDGTDGSATAGGLGGTSPYSFLWSNNAGSQTTATASDLLIGNYSVTVTDANGCSTVNSVVIEQPERLEIDFISDNVACSGDENGSISSLVNGGIPSYSYNWSTGQSGASLDSLSAGMYVLTVTDANGCTEEAQTQVLEPEELSAAVETEDVSCYGGRNGSLTLIPFGGTEPYTYSLDGENFSGSDLQIGLYAGDYSAYVQDAKGCIVYVGDYVINQPDSLTVELGENILIQYGQAIQFDPQINNAQGDISYSYISVDSTSLSCYHCAHPVVRPDYTQTYYLTIVDENGCTAEDLITIIVEKFRNVHVPTGFTPNGDNANDLLVVHGKDIANVNVFRVFDRWGEIVYEDSDFDVNDNTRGWDGTFRGKEMNPGVFIWYVEVEFIDGVIDSYKGNTTLIR